VVPREKLEKTRKFNKTTAKSGAWNRPGEEAGERGVATGPEKEARQLAKHHCGNTLGRGAKEVDDLNQRGSDKGGEGSQRVPGGPRTVGKKKKIDTTQIN